MEQGTNLAKRRAHPNRETSRETEGVVKYSLLTSSSEHSTLKKQEPAEVTRLSPNISLVRFVRDGVHFYSSVRALVHKA